MKHLFLLKNNDEYRKLEEIINEVLEDEDVEILYLNSEQEVTDAIVRKTEPYRIYAVGGDGTVNLIMQKLVHTSHQLCVLPLGTGNDFIKMISEETDFKKLLIASKTADVIKIDTVKVNDRYYINTACFGIDALVANHVHDTPDIPLIPKDKSYVIAIIQNVLKYPFYKIKVKLSDRVIYDGRITLGTVNNGRYYGGGFEATPHSKLDDGVFEVLLVDQMPFRSIPYYIYKLIRKELWGLKRIHYYQGDMLELETEAGVNLDGEEVKGTHFIFTLEAKSLNLVKYEK